MQDELLSGGVHIGLKQITQNMKRFVYKVRPDGLAVMDVKQIEERLKTAAQFIARFDTLIAVSRKGSGQKPAKKFAEVVGGKAITGRFLPGIITNPSFRAYFEPDVLIVTDPLIDKQAVREAVKMRVPVVALCDTFNETINVDYIIPCNNKGRRAVATVYRILAREILKTRGTIKKDTEFVHSLEDFEPRDDEAREVRRERPLKRRTQRRR